MLGSEPGCNRGALRGRFLQRLAVTRALALADFAALVQWRGMLPRWLHARYRALRCVKRLVGNRRYDSVRERMLFR